MDVDIFDRREDNALVTCIIPYRFSAERKDYRERFGHPRLDTIGDDLTAFLVVDDGSPEETIAETRALCEELGYGYLHISSEEVEFSVGRCRNTGARYASSRYIFMHDIDLMPYDGFYRDLRNEVSAQELDEDGRHFLMVPYVFLTEEATARFRASKDQAKKQVFLHKALVADQEWVEKYSSGTSANLYNRVWYLARGGNSPDFEGWGYEDLEFNSRAIRLDKYFPLPREWPLEKFNFNTVLEWKSYKAPYRLYGDMMMMKGVALFHAWHPVVENTSYISKKNENRDIFIKKIKTFPATNEEPAVLESAVSDPWIIFRKTAFTSNRMLRASLGRLVLSNADEVDSRKALEDLVREHNGKGIVFFNPYEKPHMLKVLSWAREAKIPYFIGERGALPGSSFLDPTGFLCDGTLYDRDKWDREPSEAQRKEAASYLDALRASKGSLEKQPPSIGTTELRKKLGIPKGNKVIFVSLQRPGDSVTRFFGREVTYPQYLKQISEFCSSKPANVSIVIKTHPLEDDKLDCPGAVSGDDYNIYDLVQLSDLIWTYNSGVGVLAMIWNKPVALSGRSFYQIDGINKYVDTPQDVVTYIQNLPEYDAGAAERFLTYLITKVYSFGNQVTKPVKMPDGSRMTATIDIDYSVLRIGDQETRYAIRQKPKVAWDSILFDRYRFSEKLFQAEQKKQAGAARSSKEAPAKPAPSAASADAPAANKEPSVQEVPMTHTSSRDSLSGWEKVKKFSKRWERRLLQTKPSTRTRN